mgnify:FL=1
MKRAELDKLIASGKTFDEIISDNCDDFYIIIDRESLLDFAIYQINEGRLFLARHILDAVDSNYADWYSYDANYGTLETPTAIISIEDLYDYVD